MLSFRSGKAVQEGLTHIPFCLFTGKTSESDFLTAAEISAPDLWFSDAKITEAMKKNRALSPVFTKS